MKIAHKNFSVYAGGEKVKPEEQTGIDKKRKSVYIGKQADPVEERVEQKRKAARKQAAKVLLDQFTIDQEIADSIDTRRERKKELLAEKAELENAQTEAQKQIDILKEQIPSSEEEKQELQERILEEQKAFLEYGYEAFQKNNEICETDKALRQTKIDILQYSGMIDAVDNADSIIENASDQIVGMLIQEAKEHMDEEMQEKVEQAKKKEEEKEEREEELEKTKKEKEEAEALTETIGESNRERVKVDQELKEIVKESELLEEELKGLIVDSGV